jgi:hypothetical protein
MFRLVKWYFDVISDEGVAAIMYMARLEWGGLRVRYASVLQSAASAPPRESATLRGVERPQLAGGTLRWANAALQVSGRWTSDAPPIRRTLASGPSGVIQWMCHMPRARAVVQCGDVTLSGYGYVESLRLTMPPADLPFRTLRWGHHASTSHSVVWIDWRGEDARRWVWLDGQEQPDATLTESGISGLGDGGALQLADSRDVLDRRVLASLGAVVPMLGRHLVGPPADMHEHKILSRSAIVRAGQPVDRGWALHEVVTW